MMKSEKEVNECQLLRIDPRDGIMPQTELDDHCEKLAVDRSSSEVLLLTQLTDDDPVYCSLSIHLL